MQAESRILIVEDEIIVGEYLRLCVNRLGHEVTTVVATGEAAMDAVEANLPDIILMDIKLRGGMDGVSTAALILQKHDIPIVFLTAYADGPTLERAKMTSPAGYVHKPFREADLRSAIEIALYKHKTDKKLKENERWLSTILRGIGDAVIVTDADENVAFLNPAAEAITGWSLDDARGRTVDEVLQVKDEETATAYPHDSSSPFSRLRLRSVLTGRNGARVPVSQKISRMTSEKGESAGSVFVIRDVSDTFEAENALLESEAKQRALLGAFDGFVYTCNADYRIGYMNEKMIRHIGRDATGAICYEALNGFDAPCAWCSNEAVFGGATVRREYRSPRDGLWYHMINTPMPGPRGPAKLALVIDITDRKTMEEALEERKNFIESVLANIQSGLIVLDSDMRIRYVNPHAAGILGVAADEAVSRTIREWSPDLAVAVASAQAGEIQCATLPGEPVIGYRKCLLRNQAGEAEGTIVSLQDLTEIIKIRLEIQTKHRLAAMGEVVARVAHEMRNPLFGITAAAQILDMELPMTEGQKELMNSLLGEARRLNNLVEELLDSSKEMKLSKRTVRLSPVVDDVLAISRVFLTAKELRVEKRIDGDLEIVADRDRLSQVILNLLKNAADACPRKGGIVVEASVSGGFTRLDVADSGPGVPEDSIDKIFDVFYTTKRHGTGLGLYISRRIVESHGGSISVANAPAGGAVFTFSIPAGDR